MSRLETALRRAIEGLDPEDRSARRIALGNVRGHMMRLLAVYDPPLSAAEIEGKIDEIDSLIRAIEAEFAPPMTRPPESRAFDDAPPELAAEPPLDEDDALDPDALVDIEDDPSLDAPPPPRRTGLVIAALAMLAMLVAGLVYLATELRSASGDAELASAPVAAPVDQAETEVTDAAPPAESAATPPASTAAEGGTDALESTDIPIEGAPAATPAPPEPASPEAAVPPASPEAAPAPAVTPEPETVAPPAGPPAEETLVVFDGHDPAAFKASTDNPVRFEGGTGGGFVRLASSTTSNGTRLAVGPGVHQRIAGRSIRIVVVARGAPGNPSPSLRLAYQNGRQLSGWFDQKLTDHFQSLAMTWAVPEDRGGPENDAILIEPGIPGDQTAVEIRSVSIDILP